MSLAVPSEDEQQLFKCRALYLGTALYAGKNRKFDDASVHLSQLQDTIAERYPVDGSNFAKGVETWLSIYPSGLQMEHSSSKELFSVSGLFYYPIKSLIYCGALRFATELMSGRQSADEDADGKHEWRFVPLDTETATLKGNLKNPPLFTVFLKGIDPLTKKQIVEAHLFVVGMKKTAMKLVESCQQAFVASKTSVSEFYKKYGNVPVVYCLKDEIADKPDKRVVVKSYDINGYFYATENTPIDWWQLFETATSKKPPGTDSRSGTLSRDQQVPSTAKLGSDDSDKEVEFYTESNYNTVKTYINPYEKTDNLVGVDKRVDPVTGQKIYVRWLAKPDSDSPKVIEKVCYETNTPTIPLYETTGCDSPRPSQPPIVIREEETPSPIIVEKYIKKRAPQVIIKEIHVTEPAPPPIKVVQRLEHPGLMPGMPMCVPPALPHLRPSKIYQHTPYSAVEHIYAKHNSAYGVYATTNQIYMPPPPGLPLPPHVQPSIYYTQRSLCATVAPPPPPPLGPAGRPSNFCGPIYAHHQPPNLPPLDESIYSRHSRASVHRTLSHCTNLNGRRLKPVERRNTIYSVPKKSDRNEDDDYRREKKRSGSLRHRQDEIADTIDNYIESSKDRYKVDDKGRKIYVIHDGEVKQRDKLTRRRTNRKIIVIDEDNRHDPDCPRHGSMSSSRRLVRKPSSTGTTTSKENSRPVSREVSLNKRSSHEGLPRSQSSKFTTPPSTMSSTRKTDESKIKRVHSTAAPRVNSDQAVKAN